MDSQRVLADTSLFIEHLRAKDKTATLLYRLTNQKQVETCAIVAAEIYYGARKKEAEDAATALLQPFIVHPFTLSMAARQSAILIPSIKLNRTIDLRDLMIGVTAIELEMPIATLNRAHFDGIPGLEVFAM